MPRSSKTALAAIPRPQPGSVTIARKHMRGSPSNGALAIWARGYEAAGRGEEFSTCPYRAGTGFGQYARNAWESGWRQREAEKMNGPR